jgi:hypothetical protein
VHAINVLKCKSWVFYLIEFTILWMYEGGTGKIAMDEVACSGHEARIADCWFRNPPTCVHEEDVGVRCGGTISSFRQGL